MTELGTSLFEKAKWESSITERLLGNSDGYYLYDEFPAYRLEPTGNCIVAFHIDRDTGKVKKAVIEPDGCAD